MAESRARTLANLANTNALSVDSSSLDVGISSASPDSDLNVGASIKMDGPSGIITATSFSGDGSALTGIANTAVIAATQLTVTGVVTATSFTGDGANLTNVGVDTATVDTGSLKVSGISTLAGVVNASSDVRISGNINAGISTFGVVSVTSITGDGSGLTGVANTDTIAAASLTVSGITTTSSIINGTALSHRNIIINGAMRVAQRGTSSTSSGYGDVDRWLHEYAGTDANPTFSQSAVVSSDSGDNPFAKGLSKCAKITNADQTSNLQATSQINFNQNIEAQNIRNSGWDYNNPNSFITLSYYIKASVAQEYHGFVKTADGSMYMYPFTLGTLTANTWTKITKTIPGNANLQIDDNTGSGFQVWPVAIYGTSYTSSGTTNNAWAAWNSAARTTDQTATWYNTNASTIEVTGVQFEVGPVATPFEHLPHSDDLARCQRYFYNVLDYNDGDHNDADNNPVPTATYYTDTNLFCHFTFPVAMRAVPTFVETSGVSGHYRAYRGGGTNSFDSFNDGIWVASTKSAILEADSGISGTGGYSAFIKSANSTCKYTAFVAEL